MATEFNFASGTSDFGREMLLEVVKSDYGPGCSYNGIGGHETRDHHGGMHDQVSVYNQGVSRSHLTMRFFDNE